MLYHGNDVSNVITVDMCEIDTNPLRSHIIFEKKTKKNSVFFGIEKKIHKGTIVVVMVKNSTLACINLNV